MKIVRGNRKYVKLLNGMVVYQTLLKDILSKMKKCRDVNVTINEDFIRFDYRTRTGQGNMIVKDLSAHFEGEELPISNLLEEWLV